MKTRKIKAAIIFHHFSCSSLSQRELSDRIWLELSFNTTASLNHTPRCQGGSKSETELIDGGGSLTDNIVRVTLK